MLSGASDFQFLTSLRSDPPVQFCISVLYGLLYLGLPPIWVIRTSSQCNCGPRASLTEADLQKLNLKTVLFRELTIIDDGGLTSYQSLKSFPDSKFHRQKEVGEGHSHSGAHSCPSGEVINPIWGICDVCASSLVFSYILPWHCRCLGSGTSWKASQVILYLCHPRPPLGALGWKEMNFIKQTIKGVFMLGC